jgi:hypothetical protein
MPMMRVLAAVVLAALSVVAVGAQTEFQVDCVPDTTVPNQPRVVCTIVMDGADASAFCGFGYEERMCGDVPGACDIDAAPGDRLPIDDFAAVSKATMHCMDAVTDEECQAQVGAMCAAKALDRGACSCAKDPCTEEETRDCEILSVSTAVCPNPADPLPEPAACVAVTELRFEELTITALAQAITARYGKLPSTSPSVPEPGGH